MDSVKYNEIIKIFGSDRYINLLEEISNFFPSFNDINREQLKKFNSFLRHKASNNYLIENVILFHGTSDKHNIEEFGIKKTTLKNKKSIQSQTGFVYLSLFPDMAKKFGELAYPYDNISVYAVKVPLKDLRVDKDQLFNKRLYGDFPEGTIKDTIADSLLYGSGARIKRDIKPYEVRNVTDILSSQKVNKISKKL